MARSPSRLASVLAGVLLATTLAIAAVVAASWARAPVGCELAGDAVHVLRRHAADVRIPLGQVLGVVRLREADLRGARRVSGVVVGSAAYGRFRSEALGRFTLYAYRPSGGCVLLDLGEERVVVTVDDPDAFVGAIRTHLIAR